MKFLLIFLLPIIVSCSMLTSLATDSLMPNKGGISAELVLGDKNQTLGSNQDVKANTVGNIVGANDNSLAIARATDVVVTNNTFPVWAVILLLIMSGLVGWLAPRPQMWKRLIGRKT